MNREFKPPWSRQLLRSLAIALSLSVVGLAVAAGLYARFAGLGERPLAVDEFYFVVSVRSILESGTPNLPGGGFYARGVLLQYLAAASGFVFGDSNFAYRLPSVLFTLATALCMFVYARRVLGPRVAALLAILLIVSSWQVEFGRFARMYAGFQFATAAMVVALDRICWGKRWRLRYVPHALAALVVATHELGVLLVPLILLPMVVWRGELFWTRSRQVGFAVTSTIVGLVLVMVSRVDFRGVGVTDRYPEGFLASPGPGVLRAPVFPFWRVADDANINLLFLVGVLAVTGLVLAVSFRDRRGNPTRTSTVPLVCMVLAAVASLAHNFVLAIGLGGAAVVHCVGRCTEIRRQLSLWAGVTIALLVAWLGTAVVFSDRLLEATGRSQWLGGMRSAFLSFPDFYTPLLLPWAHDLPLLGFAIALACVGQFVRVLRQPLVTGLRNPVVLIAYVCVAVGVLESPYTSSRYMFFIYPFGLYLLFVTTRDLATWAAARFGVVVQEATVSVSSGVAVVALFGLSGDFNPGHLTHVTDDAVTFRTGSYARFDGLWYPRRDYRSVAGFLERAVAAGEPVIAVGLPAIAHYLERPPAVFFSRLDRRFQDQARRRGTINVWTGAPLLSTDTELREFTREDRRVWVVWSGSPSGRPFDVTRVWAGRLAGLRTVFVSPDSAYEVVEVVLRVLPASPELPPSASNPPPAAMSPGGASGGQLNRP